MYTGIVQALLPVVAIEEKTGLTSFAVEFPDDLTAGLDAGASVSVNGVCFTVTRMAANRVWFDAIAETLALSNIKYVRPGSRVNIERSAAAGAEIGGHILSGHVIDTAPIVDIQASENNRRLSFEGSTRWMKYVFNKGFLALNGCSLTVAAVDRAQRTFAVNLIPETLERTNFRLLEVGDEVNVEIDQQTQVIVDTVERVMAERFAESA